MVKQRVLIVESDNVWKLTNLHYGICRQFATLANALKYVKENDKKRANEVGAVVTQIEVIAKTKLGLAIAKALVNA